MLRKILKKIGLLREGDVVMSFQSKEKVKFARDFVNMKKTRITYNGTNRPKWNGPIPDRYYYAVKNKKHPTYAAYICRYTDDPNFEKYVRQIAVKQGGEWSLIESDIPLPENKDCVKRRHGKVDIIKRKLHNSNPQRSTIVNVSGKHETIAAKIINEDEVFG